MAKAYAQRRGCMFMELGGAMIKALLLSMVVASIAFFISHSQLLEKFRNWLWDKTNFLGELVACCYCLSHWVTAVLLVFLPVKLFGIWGPADYALTWLVIAWFAGLQSLAASQLWGE